MLWRTYLSFIVALTPAVGLPHMATPGPPSTVVRDGPDARATLKDANGRTVGVVRVNEQKDGATRVRVAVENLPAGFHGLHLHAKGVCDPSSTDPATGSPFASAGRHLGMGSHPDHAGDLPNLMVGKDGRGRATFLTDRFGLDRLRAPDGASVVVHARADNAAQIPDRYRPGTKGPDAETLKAGDSGDRIACGVIRVR